MSTYGQGGSPFDLMESSMMDVVASTMGYYAEWTPSAGGDKQSGQVLFQDPTKSSSVANTAFLYDRPYMEYKLDIFDGLKLAVSNTHNNESVMIFFSGKLAPATQMFVRQVDRKWDGKTFLALLQEAL